MWLLPDPGPPVGGQRDGLQGLGTRGASKPCYRQEEGKCMAGMLSTHCHQQPPQQTSSSHSPAELQLGLHAHLGSHHPRISEGMQ